MKKYISTTEAVRLTGLTTQQIYDLIHEGKLPAHMAPKKGWRMLPEDLVDLGLMKDDHEDTTELPLKKTSPETPPIVEEQWIYIADEKHFTEVFKRMTEVKHSLKIATGDLKNFGVYVDGKKKSIRLCDFFFSLVKRGVRVQVVCMKPFSFYLYARKNCPDLFENKLFELRLNEHNHMKVFIFDDEAAYIGSANITSAAIGKRDNRNRNHEAGILMCGTNMIEGPLKHFESVWKADETLDSSWKRFKIKVKKYEKLRSKT